MPNLDKPEPKKKDYTTNLPGGRQGKKLHFFLIFSQKKSFVFLVLFVVKIKLAEGKVKTFFCGLKVFTVFTFRRYIKISYQKIIRLQILGTYELR